MRNGSKKILLNAAGFTMLEIIIAISILAAMVLTMTQITNGIVKTNDDVTALNDQRHSVVLALSKISDDIRMAFLVDKKYYGTDQCFFTGFVGTSTSLNFSTLSNVHYVKNRRDTDQIQVGYSLISGEDGYSNLMRRQTDYLTDKLETGGNSFVLLDHVKEVRFEYYDANKKSWEQSLDTGSVSSAGTLPSMVRVYLTVVGSPISEDSDTREEMSYQLQVPIELYAIKIGA